MSFSRVVTDGAEFIGGGVSLPDRKMVSFAPHADAETNADAISVSDKIRDLRAFMCTIVILIPAGHKSFNTKALPAATSSPSKLRNPGRVPLKSWEIGRQSLCSDLTGKFERNSG